MQALKELVFNLCAQPGTPGNEDAAAQHAIQELSRFGEAETDTLGNVVCHMGTHGAKRHILLDAHLDHIGMIVTEITKGGFLRVAQCGGVDRRTLTGSTVVIYGKEPVMGIVCSTPPHLRGGDADKLPEMGKFAIDTGMTKEEAEALISPGDRVGLPHRPRSLAGERVSCAGLDDRAGCAALLRAAELVNGKLPDCELTILFSSREETGEQGARVGAYAIDPTEAIAVDVSYAKQPGLRPEQGSPLGSGPMLGVSPILNREMGAKLESIAKKLAIPFTYEVMGGNTGTNADAIAVNRGGVKTALLSIPLRYMHTPVEVIDLNDVENTARLIAEYILDESH